MGWPHSEHFLKETAKTGHERRRGWVREELEELRYWQNYENRKNIYPFIKFTLSSEKSPSGL